MRNITCFVKWIKSARKQRQRNHLSQNSCRYLHIYKVVCHSLYPFFYLFLSLPLSLLSIAPSLPLSHFLYRSFSLPLSFPLSVPFSHPHSPLRITSCRTGYRGQSGRWRQFNMKKMMKSCTVSTDAVSLPELPRIVSVLKHPPRTVLPCLCLLLE